MGHGDGKNIDSDLPEILRPADDDVLVLDDVSAKESRRVTVANLRSATAARVDLYVSDINGDDANEGTETAAPIKTVIEAEKRIADNVARGAPVVIHLGKHGGSGYDLATLLDRLLHAGVSVIGDGAGQPGEDGFTVLRAEEAAESGSGSGKVVTSGGMSTDEFEGKTVEITSGNAKGDRRTIQSTTATDIFPATRFSAAVSSGDTFRVVEPSVEIRAGQRNEDIHNYDLMIGGGGKRRAFADTASGSPALNGINFRLIAASDNINRVDIALDGHVRLFGVEGKTASGAPLSFSGPGTLDIGHDSMNPGNNPRAQLAVDIFGEQDEKNWLGWGVSNIGAEVQIDGLVFKAVSVVADNIFFLHHCRGDLIGGRAGLLWALWGAVVDVSGKIGGLSDTTFVASQVKCGGGPGGFDQFSYIDIGGISIDNQSGNAVEADGNVQVRCRDAVSVSASGDGLFATKGGRINIRNGEVSIGTVTGDETKVADPEGVAVTRTIANYSSDGAYISAPDGSVIQREN